MLERGAIEGEIFHRGAVQALAPEETQVTPRLAALVRKELIRPDRPQLAGEDGFRFRHLLIRDAAYDALPKATRAELHERFAAWLEQHGTELVELDEILGYHLEQACRYRAELGLPADDELAAAARRRLTAAGQPRGSSGQDYGAAVSLLERAAALVPPAEFDLALETELVDALFWTGRGDEALRRADSLAERASAAGDRVGELCGEDPRRPCSACCLEPEGATEKLAALVEQALPVFQAAGDDLALYIAYSRARGGGAACAGRWTQRWRHYEQAVAHARQAGHVPAGVPGVARRLAASSARHPCRSCSRGSTRTSHEQGGTTSSVHYRAGALAMLGRFDEARAILAEARAELAERGGGVLLADITAFESVRRRALGRRSRRRSRVRSRRVQAARGAGRTELPVDRGGEASRRRSTRSTGSTRPTPGPAAPRSSARATTR